MAHFPLLLRLLSSECGGEEGVEASVTLRLSTYKFKLESCNF